METYPKQRQERALSPNVVADVEKISRSFPEKSFGTRVESHLKAMGAYSWKSQHERNKALEHVRGMCCALALESPKQAQLQYLRAEDRLNFDYANTAIELANDCGFQVRPLAKLNQAPAKTFRIRGPRNGWLFRDLDEYGGVIPPGVLQVAAAIKSLGVEWERSYIGEPHVERTVSLSRTVRDPIFAISIGRWILEVARWE